MIMEEAWRQIPPCISYQDFSNFIVKLRQHLPTRVDRSWGEMFSASTGPRLISAMRFLNLIDLDARPTFRLKLLVSGSTGGYRAIILRRVADEAYSFVLKGVLDTQNATYSELESVFLDTYRIERDVCRKCINFFIDFCEDAGIPLSPQITQKQQKPRASPGITNTTHKWIGYDRRESEYENNTSDNRLQQVRFLHTLAKDFKHFDRMDLKAKQTLNAYEKIPNEMTEAEWHRVWIALSECYESVRFLYRIALLTESEIIDLDLLYIFYHADIVENATFKLNRLIKWCGTGLDLAANYTSYELARIGAALIKLIEELNIVHQRHGADLITEGNSGFLEDFKERTKDFFSNPGNYSADSLNTLNRVVGIRKEKHLPKTHNLSRTDKASQDST